MQGYVNRKLPSGKANLSDKHVVLRQFDWSSWRRLLRVDDVESSGNRLVLLPHLLHRPEGGILFVPDFAVIPDLDVSQGTQVATEEKGNGCGLLRRNQRLEDRLDVH